MPARGISTCRDAPCGHLPPGIFPRHHTLLHLPPLRASSPGHLPPGAHLPPGIFPLAGIFPRASSHAIIPSCTCPPCGHLPPGIFPRHHTLLHLPPLRASSPGHLPTPSYPLISVQRLR